MEREREPYGLIFWAGGQGTSRDIPFQKAPTFLVYKEYVASTGPEIERMFALQNMKQWICCIVQCCDNAGEPFKGPLLPALFLNDLPGVTTWLAIGEVNKDDVFHLHVMLKSTQRADAVRRSMFSTWNNLTFCDNLVRRFGKDCQLDVVKIQRCHKPESMMKYMMKNPEWVMSNNEQILQLMYDIDLWGLNAKYKEQKEQPTDTGEMNSMVKDLIDVIIAGSCKTLEDCLRADPQTMAKYLHRPGLTQILTNCLAYCRATGSGWNISQFSNFPPDPTLIHAILLHQGLVPSVCDLIFWQWINKLDSKRNTLVLYGPSNTGKSAFIAGFKHCAPWGECLNGNNFNFEALVDQVVGVWEEPLINPETAEKAKQIFEGMPCSISIKYKAPKILPRTPIIITTNHHLWRFCAKEQDAFLNRIWIWPFEHPVKDVPFTYRTSEHSCKCISCATSRGCPTPDVGASAGRMQTANKPLSTGEHGHIRTKQTTDVGTGSLCDPGEGPSGCHSSKRSRSTSSTDSECSEHAGPASGTSTTISADIRSFGSVETRHTGNRDDRPITSDVHDVEPDISPGRDGRSGGGDGKTKSGKQPYKRRHGGTVPHTSEPHSSVSLGLRETNLQEKEKIPVPTRQPGVDRQMAPITNLTVPTKQDWSRYLSFLLTRYG